MTTITNSCTTTAGLKNSSNNSNHHNRHSLHSSLQHQLIRVYEIFPPQFTAFDFSVKRGFLGMIQWLKCRQSLSKLQVLPILEWILPFCQIWDQKFPFWKVFWLPKFPYKLFLPISKSKLCYFWYFWEAKISILVENKDCLQLGHCM